MSKNCNIVKDLLPLYVDGLTSDESNKFIEEHLQTCEECKLELENMKIQEISSNTEDDVKTIDYLKKVKSKNRIRVLIFSSLILIAIFLVPNLIPREINNLDEVVYSFDEGASNEILANISTRSQSKGLYLSIKEEGDRVFITPKTTPYSWFYSNSEIKNLGIFDDAFQIYIKDKLVYDNHNTITNSMWNLYEKKVKYVGDNSDVLNLLNQGLKLSEKFGPFSIELKTASIEKGLKIVFEEDIDSPTKNLMLYKNLLLIHSMIENVDNVEAYSENGSNLLYKVRNYTDYKDMQIINLKVNNIQDLYNVLDIYELKGEYIN